MDNIKETLGTYIDSYLQCAAGKVVGSEIDGIKVTRTFIGHDSHRYRLELVAIVDALGPEGDMFKDVAPGEPGHGQHDGPSNILTMDDLSRLQEPLATKADVEETVAWQFGLIKAYFSGRSTAQSIEIQERIEKIDSFLKQFALMVTEPIKLTHRAINETLAELRANPYWTSDSDDKHLCTVSDVREIVTEAIKESAVKTNHMINDTVMPGLAQIYNLLTKAGE